MLGHADLGGPGLAVARGSLKPLAALGALAALLAAAGCGGSKSRLDVFCGEQPSLTTPATLPQATRSLRAAIRAERELAAALPDDRRALRDRARAAAGVARRTLSAIEQPDPQSMTPLRSAVETAGRELGVAKALLNEACAPATVD